MFVPNKGQNYTADADLSWVQTVNLPKAYGKASKHFGGGGGGGAGAEKDKPF